MSPAERISGGSLHFQREANSAYQNGMTLSNYGTNTSRHITDLCHRQQFPVNRHDMSQCIKSFIQNLNIVVGCTIGCSYCYARNNCRRYHMTPDFSTPEYMPHKLRRLETPRPHTLLLTGMSDFSDWRPNGLPRYSPTSPATRSTPASSSRNTPSV